jgi:4-amino-4-deoxy-L-arabinose transferase-like glycosyltransferase
LSERGPAAISISREVADSMVRHGFLDGDFHPDLLAPGLVRVAEDQRVHPPFYYAFIASPLRLVRFLSVETQLYTVRAISLLLYVLTVITGWRIATVIAPDEPLAQQLITLAIVLVPSFADLMTAVNNDVLLNFAVAVALLGSLLLVRDGPRSVPAALALLGLAVAIASKRTGLSAVVPVALACLWSVWREPLRPRVVLAGCAFLVVLAVAAVRPSQVDMPGGPHLVLEVRPWLDTLDRLYLRLNINAWMRSVSDLSGSIRPYQALAVVGFTSFWVRLSWGNVALPPLWGWLFAGLCLASVIGLVAGAPRLRALPLVQRRSLWLFVVAVIMGALSLAARLHPLPPADIDAYIPRGRYMFWTMVPVVWLLVFGLQQLVPQRWRSYVLYGLAGFMAAANLTALWMLLATYWLG